MYRTKEKERESEMGEFGFKGHAGRWSMSCEKIFSFLLLYLQGKLMTRYSYNP